MRHLGATIAVPSLRMRYRADGELGTAEELAVEKSAAVVDTCPRSSVARRGVDMLLLLLSAAAAAVVTVRIPRFPYQPSSPWRCPS